METVMVPILDSTGNWSASVGGLLKPLNLNEIYVPKHTTENHVTWFYWLKVDGVCNDICCGSK